MGQSLSVPFKLQALNGVLVWDGKVFRWTPSAVQIPDGIINQWQFKKGLLESASYAPTAGYTPPACLPGGGGTKPPAGEVKISPQQDNLTVQAQDGLLTVLHTKNTDTVTWEGAGTAANPIRAVAKSSGGSGEKGTTYTFFPPLSATPPTNGVSKVSIKPSPLKAGTYGGFTTDSVGRIVGYTAEEPPFPGVQNVVFVKGVQLTKDNNEYQLDVQSGSMVIDRDGRIISIS